MKAFKSAVLSKKLIDAVRLGPKTQIFGPRPILPLRFTQTRWQRNARAPITTCHNFTRTDKFWTRVLGHGNEASSVGSTWLSRRRWLSFIHAKSELPATGGKSESFLAVSAQRRSQTCVSPCHRNHARFQESDKRRERKEGEKKKKNEAQRLLVGRARGSKWDRDALLSPLSNWRPNKRGWTCGSQQPHSQHINTRCVSTPSTECNS